MVFNDIKWHWVFWDGIGLNWVLTVFVDTLHYALVNSIWYIGLNNTRAMWAKGSLFKGPRSYRDLFDFVGPYLVPIYISGSLFSVFWLNSCKECQFSLQVRNNELTWSVHCTVCSLQQSFEIGYGPHICRYWFSVTLLVNVDFNLCLRVGFHKSSSWVYILAAEGPYWVHIS